MDVARTCRLAYAATLGLTALVGANQSQARAADMAAQLDYGATQGCPTAAEFEAVVTGRLGYSPFRPAAGERVIVRIADAGRALEGRLEWRDAKGEWIGEQRFPSRTGKCGELARAMAFALALQIQLMATTAAAPRAAPEPPPAKTALVQGPTEPSPAVVVNPLSPPSPSPAPTKTAPGSVGPMMALGAGAAVGVGMAASAVALGRLLGTASWSHIAVELSAEVSSRSTTRRPDGAGFIQQHFLAGLAGCGVRPRWSGCLVTKIGQIRVAGQGVDMPAVATGLFVQGGLRLALTHTFATRFMVGVHADGLALMTQGIVTLDSVPVWTAPRVAGLVGATLSVRFR